MKKKLNVKLFLIASVIALMVAFTCALPTTAMAEGETPEEKFGYTDKTVVYDGHSHWIEIDESALPHGSVIKFNTIEKEPGVYAAHADIEVDGQVVTVNATLTILATELKDGEGTGSIVVNKGVDPTVVFDLKESDADYSANFAKGDKVYANYSVSVTKDGSAYALAVGEYELRVKAAYGYTGVKAYVNEGGVITEKEVNFKSGYVSVTVNEDVEGIVLTYEKTVALHGEKTNSFLWLQIVLGVLVAGEALTIVLQALKLKKM